MIARVAAEVLRMSDIKDALKQYILAKLREDEEKRGSGLQLTDLTHDKEKDFKPGEQALLGEAVEELLIAGDILHDPSGVIILKKHV